jgi:hypothetical protein
MSVKGRPDLRAGGRALELVEDDGGGGNDALEVVGVRDADEDCAKLPCTL